VFTVPNRAVFRVEAASITPTSISISGVEDTRFGDIDALLKRTKPSWTFGDEDGLVGQIEAAERLGAYTFGMSDQEPMRFEL